MNAQRRKLLSKVYADLRGILEAEEEAYENLPESLQGGERGTAMEEAIDQIRESMEALEGIDPDCNGDDLGDSGDTFLRDYKKTQKALRIVKVAGWDCIRKNAARSGT